MSPGNNEILKAVRNARGRFRAIGWALVVLGALALIFPIASSVLFKALLGWFMLIAGAVMLWNAFQARDWKSALWSGLVGLLYLAAGVYLAFFLFAGLIGLTALMATLFLFQGGAEAVIALQNRQTRSWIWLMISAFFSVGLGLILLFQLPEAALWAIGLIMGINLLSTGISFLALVRATAPFDPKA